MLAQYYAGGLLGAPPPLIVSPTQRDGQHMVDGQGGFHMPWNLFSACLPTLHVERGISLTTKLLYWKGVSTLHYCVSTHPIFFNTHAQVMVACRLLCLKTESPRHMPLPTTWWLCLLQPRRPPLSQSTGSVKYGLEKCSPTSCGGEEHGPAQGLSSSKPEPAATIA
jgi:hypothetical protein